MVDRCSSLVVYNFAKAVADLEHLAKDMRGYGAAVSVVAYGGIADNRLEVMRQTLNRDSVCWPMEDLERVKLK